MFHQHIVAEHRFFFALVPPIRLAREIANAAHWFGDDGRAVAAERLHVTLFILADQFAQPAELIAQLRTIGGAVAAAPVAMSLDYVSGGARSIALRPQRKIAGLSALRDALVAACRAAQIEERPDHTFSPHVTLGYRDGRSFGERVPPAAWTADEFVLIHSHLGRTKHTVLGRWPLAGSGDGQLSLL